MRKKVLLLFLCSIFAFSSANIAYAKDTDIIENIDIVEETEEQPTEEDDNWNKEDGYEWSIESQDGYNYEENITITGNSENIIIKPDDETFYNYNNVQPGDGGQITINFSNESDEVYKITDATHEDSKLSQHSGGNPVDFDAEKVISYLKTTGGWRRGNHDGLDDHYGSPTMQYLLEQAYIKDGVTRFTDKNISTYVNQETVLAYYNFVNETNFTSFYDAWNYNFFNRCWDLEYKDKDLKYKDKDLKDINLNSDTLIINWSLDDTNTDNAYQNTMWSWNDIIYISRLNDSTEEAVIPSDKDEDSEEYTSKISDNEENNNITTNENEDEKIDTPAEKVSNTKQITSTPKTGDLNSIKYYGIICIIVIILVIIFLIKKLKKH